MSLRQPAEAYHPGEFLMDELDARSWSAAELARRCDVPKEAIDRILASEVGYSVRIAERFQSALGSSAAYWMNQLRYYEQWSGKQLERIP